jgi:hypothetical protein
MLCIVKWLHHTWNNILKTIGAKGHFYPFDFIYIIKWLNYP